MKIRSSIILLTVLFVLPSVRTSAQTGMYRHEVIFGAGDPLTEALFYRKTPPKDYSTYNPSVTYVENQGYHYLPHFYMEYYYTFKPWFSLGGQVDVGSFHWKKVYFKGGSNVPVSAVKQNNFNISVLPSARFTYLRREHVRLFSTVRIGIDINTGSEEDYKGRHTAVGVCIDPTIIGVSYLGGHWTGSFELGGMSALADASEIFMFASKLFTISVGYRF